MAVRLSAKRLYFGLVFFTSLSFSFDLKASKPYIRIAQRRSRVETQTTVDPLLSSHVLSGHQLSINQPVIKVPKVLSSRKLLEMKPQLAGHLYKWALPHFGRSDVSFPMVF